MADFQTIRCAGCGKVVGELRIGEGRYICRTCKGTTTINITFEEPQNPERVRLLGTVNYPPYQERNGIKRK